MRQVSLLLTTTSLSVAKGVSFDGTNALTSSSVCRASGPVVASVAMTGCSNSCCFLTSSSSSLTTQTDSSRAISLSVTADVSSGSANEITSLTVLSTSTPIVPSLALTGCSGSCLFLTSSSSLATQAVSSRAISLSVAGGVSSGAANELTSSSIC